MDVLGFILTASASFAIGWWLGYYKGVRAGLMSAHAFWAEKMKEFITVHFVEEGEEDEQ